MRELCFDFCPFSVRCNMACFYSSFSTAFLSLILPPSFDIYFSNYFQLPTSTIVYIYDLRLPSASVSVIYIYPSVSAIYINHLHILSVAVIYMYHLHLPSTCTICIYHISLPSTPTYIYHLHLPPLFPLLPLLSASPLPKGWKSCDLRAAGHTVTSALVTLLMLHEIWLIALREKIRMSPLLPLPLRGMEEGSCSVKYCLLNNERIVL